MSKHQSDSTEQQTAEEYMLNALEKDLGICFNPEARLPNEVGVQPDAIDPDNKVIVEAYHRSHREWQHLWHQMENHDPKLQ